MTHFPGSTPEDALRILRAAAPRFADIRLAPVPSATANFVYRTSGGEIVRFPHNDWVREGFLRERRLLDLLDGRLGVAIPRIGHFNDAPVFMTYAAIEGTVASRDVVRTFDSARSTRFGASLGEFLARLHGEPVARYGFLPRDYGPDLLHQLRENAAAIGRRDPRGQVGAVLRRALDDWEARRTGDEPEVLLHQDLHGQNLICDPGTGDLVGVLDFTLAWFGDPVWDFPELYRCGAAILESALEVYQKRCGRTIDIAAVRTLSRLQLCRSLDRAPVGSPREAQILERIRAHP